MADAPRPSVKELAKMNIPMQGGPQPLPGMMGPRVVTPRTSLSGSFAPQPINRTPSATGSSAPGTPTISGGPPTPTSGGIASRLAGLNIPMGAPGMGPPRISTPGVGGPQIGGAGMAAPRPSLSQEELDKQQQEIGSTTRRRPSVRRNSRMSRTHFDDIDVDVSTYLDTLNQSTPRSTPRGAISLPEGSTFAEDSTAARTEEDKSVVTTVHEEEGWEVVDLNSPADTAIAPAPIKKVGSVDQDIKLVVDKLIKEVIQNVLADLDPSGEKAQPIDSTLIVIEAVKVDQQAGEIVTSVVKIDQQVDDTPPADVRIVVDKLVNDVIQTAIKLIE